MVQAALNIPVDHPSFAGHFPAQPIVPGVVLLDAAQREIESKNALRLTGLAVAKFHSPAIPGDALLLEYDIGEKFVRFEIRCDAAENCARKIADGKFLREELLPESNRSV